MSFYIACLLGGNLAGCAATVVRRPHEDQLSAWYRRIQVEEAKVDGAMAALRKTASAGERQQALASLAAATTRICDAAALISETDAELRCQMARRRAKATAPHGRDDNPLD